MFKVNSIRCARLHAECRDGPVVVVAVKERVRCSDLKGCCSDLKSMLRSNVRWRDECHQRSGLR